MAEDINHKENAVHILKNKYTLNYNDYEKLMLAKQYNKLYENSDIINKENSKIKEDKRIYNLSIKNIIKNTSESMVHIINDFSNYIEKDGKNFNNFIYIFVKDDRLIYIGVVFIIISIMLFFIHLSE